MRSASGACMIQQFFRMKIESRKIKPLNITFGRRK
jgi:hypothetical protein